MIRGVGLRAATAINVATMVGAGPFITLPLVVAALHGSVSAIAWIAGALIALCDGLVWAELAARFPRSGGTYAYLREAFGPRGAGRLFAFLFAWQFIFWAPLILASGYIGFAQYAAYLVPSLAGYVPTHLVAVAVGVVTLVALYRPIPQIARTGLVLGAIALATLLVVALAGLAHQRTPLGSTLHATFALGVGLPALGSALVITLYDYAGYADVCALGDEVIAPSRTMPRAVVLSVLFVGAAYLLLNLGVVSALTPNEIAASSSVASLVAERALGVPLAIAVTLAILVTAFASTFGNLLAAARVPYAAARDGDFLPAFARLHPRDAFPSVALVAIGLLALPAAFLPLDAVIAALTAGIVLIQGVAQIVALAIVRRRAPDAPFRVPLYPLPPLVALVGWLFLFASTGTQAIAFGLGTLALGALIFFVRARRARSWPFAAALGALALALVQPRPAAAAPAFGHAVVAQRDGRAQLLVDGRPFFFWGGAFFYDRIPADRWRDSMLAMRALGANTLDLYVPWNWHELADGSFDFDGHTDPRRNLRRVLRLGAELGFHFVVRPGPVIRNEWRNGGYPAWLLTRPAYAMPLHDVLEGRYPATATRQNAHSDDAAAEWLRNPMHMRYAARWLRRALAEFRPYADRVLAVQLDDDQGAYIDNQTYPAPHLQRYLAWLDAQVRTVVGPRTPTFINTYQMRVPSASPVWTMGNWYQSDAYTIGAHDRIDLDFSTLLLTLNPRGPLAQSEFQAGWLAGPEDPRPRPADPRNTTLALDELLALGVRGIIDFPMQDTYAEPGWEAPFANAFYGWDAALRYDTPADPLGSAVNDRFAPTLAFGAFVRRFAPVLLSARRAATVAIAYGEPPARPDSTPPAGADAIVARVRTALGACIEAGLSCDLVDVRRPPAQLARYATLVVPPELARAAPQAVRALRAALRGRRTRIVGAVPPIRGDGATTLAGPDGRITFAANWDDAARNATIDGSTVRVAPHTVVVRIADLSLAALGARADRRRLSSDCDVEGEALVAHGACTVTLRDGSRVERLHLPSHDALALPTLARTVSPTLLRPAAGDAGAPCRANATNRATATIARAYGSTTRRLVVLRNDRLTLTIDPDAGARAFSLRACDPKSRRWREALDATGAFRDDVSAPLPPSPRDYIAKYTHGYPAGTFNRPYRVEILSSGSTARVRLSYTMADARPSGVRFERVVSLAPHEARIVVDERLVGPAGSHTAQRAVVRSSLPLLARRGNSLDPVPRRTAGTVAAGTTTLGSYAAGFGFVVAWRAGDVAAADWTPYRSTGTLALQLAAGWRRVTYTFAPAPSLEAARGIAEAERAWVAANGADERS